MGEVALGPDEVEEIVQEVFFQLYRSLAAYRGRSSFRTWLYGLAHNVCRHQRRRRGRRLRFERPEDSVGSDSWTEVPDLAPGALDRLESGELRRRVHRRVSELAPIYRDVLPSAPEATGGHDGHAHGDGHDGHTGGTGGGHAGHGPGADPS
jgi:RNA polymerase sigma-70 factor (ECF subfamily)